MVQASTAIRVENPFIEARREQWWTSFAALFIALLVHLGAIVLLPDVLMISNASADINNEELEVILLPPEPIEKEELKFVEANPEAPENEPDRKDQYSFRAQQAADENPNKALLDAPSVDGEEDSQKIVQGAMEQVPPVTPGVYSPAVQAAEGEGTDGGKAGAPAAAMVPPAKPLPAPAFIQQDPVTEDGPGSRLETPGVGEEIVENPVPDAPINVYKPQPQTVEQQAQQEGDGSGGADVQPMPRARPTLSPDLIHGPLMRSEGSASRRGSLAIDATFSEFGEYQQQFFAALQAGWYQEIEFFQPIDTSTRVVVSFRITADGVIHDVEILHSSASEIASLICQTAITKRSPFRPWTQEMVQVFGQERVLQVVFHYR
ncbi:MAG: hypothetical protein ACI9A1_001242 [Lentimonas sp.]